MKKTTIFCAALAIFCSFSFNIYAQLEVQSSGNVTTSKNLTINQKLAVGSNIDNDVSLKIVHTSSASTNPYFGIWSHIYAANSYPTGSVYGLYGFADASNCSNTLPITQTVGVYGKAINSADLSSRFSVGLAGIAANNNGIGVYGAIGSVNNLSLPLSSFGTSYAGYFNGSVHINGTLTATTISTVSDENQKENIQEIPSLLADNLRFLKPVAYSLKQHCAWQYDTDAKELQKTHYGLIAQEVQKIYPELVYERGGQLSINYIELIPILIMKVQELSKEVEELTQRTMKPSFEQSSSQNSFPEEQTILYQNTPNPFSDDTKIGYQLPVSTIKAMLYIYNMNGLQVAEYPISVLGKGSVVVSAGSLEAGMYLYSLIADGQIIDTKRMILTK